MTSPARPTTGTARRDERSRPWFDALAHDMLLIRRCPQCGHHSRPDAAACPACQADELEWVTAAGTGTVLSVVVDHGGEDPAFLGLVELDEGPWLAVRLIADAPPVPGSRVVLQVLTPGDGEPIPGFAVVR
jgi:uncharacterized OB-fold protein